MIFSNTILGKIVVHRHIPAETKMFTLLNLMFTLFNMHIRQIAHSVLVYILVCSVLQYCMCGVCIHSCINQGRNVLVLIILTTNCREANNN